MIRFIYLVLFGLLISACGKCDDRNNPIVNSSSDIYFANSGVVPVLANVSTRTILYVHNRSKNDINNITYEASSNIIAKTPILDTDSAKLCSTIKAGGSCPLVFNTPPLNDSEFSATILFSSSYINKRGITLNSLRLVDFRKILENELVLGGFITSGVNIDVVNNTGYGMVYIYGSGLNTSYNVVSLVSSNPNIQIINGDISKTHLLSQYVQPVELYANLPVSKNTNLVKLKQSDLQETLVGDLTLITLDPTTDKTYTSVVPINKSQGLYLPINVGYIPNVDSTLNNTVSDWILNSNSTSVIINSITSSNSSVKIDYSFCNPLIGNSACIFNITVPKDSAGNTLLTFNYVFSNGQTSTMSKVVTWYSSLSPNIEIAPHTSPIIMYQGESVLDVIRIYNKGTGTLKDVAQDVSLPSDTSLVVTTASPLICYDSANVLTPNTLKPAGYCEYTLKLNAVGAIDSSYVSLNITGTSSSGVPYMTSSLLPYQVMASTPVISVTPATYAFSIVGNDSDSESKEFIVTNSGNSNATLGTIFLQNTSSIDGTRYAHILKDECSSQILIKNGGSCKFIVNFGPAPNSSIEPIVGEFNEEVPFSGDFSGSDVAISNSLYTIEPNESTSISLYDVGFAGATPIADDNWSIYGYQTNQQIVLNYKNNGDNSLQITGLSDSNNSYQWAVNPNLSTCYNAGVFPSSIIEPGNFCTIVYDNVLPTYINFLPSLGAQYSENLILPTLYLIDPDVSTQYIVTPRTRFNNSIVRVSEYLATLANTVFESGSGVGSQIIVQNMLANAQNYNPITINNDVENYFITSKEIESKTDNCNINIYSGYINQSCTLTSDPSGNAIAKVIYNFDFITYANSFLAVGFINNFGNQMVSTNTNYIVTPVN